MGETPVGTISALTERGDKTIVVCRLDRKKLDTERSEAQASALTSLHLAIIRGGHPAIRKRFLDGEPAYSAACLAVLEPAFKHLIDGLQQAWDNAGSNKL